MLIGLMFLPNQVVYIQFHPVAYMVKLNIEMSMASLVIRLARGKGEVDLDDYYHSSSGPGGNTASSQHAASHNNFQSFQLSSLARKEQKIQGREEDEGFGITRRTELNVVIEKADDGRGHGGGAGSKDNSLAETLGDAFGDETPLHKGGIRVAAAEVV
jgi:hypothetical protein